MHLAQRLEHSKIKVASVDEWLDQSAHQLVCNPGRRPWPYDPRFHVSVSFPLPAVLQQVRFERGETADRRPALTEGPQPRIDPEDETIGSIFVEQCYDLPGDAGKVLLRTQRALPIGFPPFRVQENKVDI